MKNLVLVLGLIATLNIFGQNISDKEIVMNSVKDTRLDSILNSTTPTFANHNKFKKHLLDILYTKKINVIVDMVKTKGFKGFYYLNEYNEVDLNKNTSSDSIVNSLNDFVKDLPKDKSKVNVNINDSNSIKDIITIEEYSYIKNNKTYLIVFCFINSQMDGIYLDIRTN